MKLPNVPRPCAQCPFRRDAQPGWLGADRVNEICESDSFTCHKTSAPRLQCAGHMLLVGDENAFVNLANGMGVSLNLSGRDLVFDSAEEMAEHHK